jgi:L-seryl-tRNA(Ser) seleniumtransferase
VSDNLRDLPSVDELFQSLGALPFPRTLIIDEIRRVIANARAVVRKGGECPDLAAAVRQGLEQLSRPSLREVVNATGVVLHTNLGRAPLPGIHPIRGYSNLEYDLAAGNRGKRDVHSGALFERLLGKPAIAVNNNAAAVYLVLHELAAGGEVIVSRGELIEIGDGFRIPDIMARSGAILREVGTTNRTHIQDYRDAINERTRLILRVHPSNFHISGFTSRPQLVELTALGRERGVRVYEDLGSGCLADLRSFGIQEPLVQESLDAGVDVVSFSGDKLLGGPQAGIIAGTPELIAQIRRNPMFRALRLDKMMYQLLESTLQAYLLEQWDRIPALRMIRMSASEIQQRAANLIEGISSAEVVRGESVIGGGSTPDQRLPTWLIAVDGSVMEAEQRLRRMDPPVVARIENNRLLFDLRTVLPEQEAYLKQAIQAAFDRNSRPSHA